jgi:glutaredoxin
MDSEADRTAVLYRMVKGHHLCPFGLKSRDLLLRKGYQVDDRWLTSQEETDAFKARFDVRTTPQTFIGGQRIGGYDDLRRHLGKRVPDPKAKSYGPVLAVFWTTALMALAVSQQAFGNPFTLRTAQWFIAFSMCALAMLKLRDIESFSNAFLGYDLLARRWVPYAYIYPFAELAAGVLMAAGVLKVVSVPLTLIIGGIGAVSIFKAVYIDKRELKCACVGGASNVPLGFVSLVEDLMMVGMGVWMAAA